MVLGDLIGGKPRHALKQPPPDRVDVSATAQQHTSPAKLQLRLLQLKTTLSFVRQSFLAEMASSWSSMAAVALVDWF